MKIAVLGSTLALIAVIVSGTIGIEARYANKEATKIEISQNTLLILYTQLDRANRERRRLREQDKRLPQSLLNELMRLCREIKKRGGSC